MRTINGNQMQEEVDDEIIETDIRTRNKREFEKMMKQNLYCMISRPPRRVLRSRNGVLSPKIFIGNKRKIEVNNDVVQERCNISQKPVMQYTRRPEVLVPAIVPDGDADFSLKTLLETNLLDGQLVRYVKGAVIKKREPGIADLEGRICGTNIKCFCNQCNGEQVVTPVTFESHAGSRNKNASMNIRLDNGKSLKDILKLCKKFPLDKREQQIKIAIGLADAQEGPIPSQTAEHTCGDYEAQILNRNVDYQIKCLKEHGIDDLKSVPEEASFCSTECRAVNSVLNRSSFK